MEGQTATVEAGEKKASRWEDCIDVFFSPTELFMRRARDKVAPALLILFGLAIVFYYLTLPAAVMQARAGIPPEQAGQVSEGMLRVMMIIGGIFVPITYIIIIVIAAFILWLGGRVADVRTEFGRTMLIATYSGYIILLTQVAAAVLVIVLGDAAFDPLRSNSFGIVRFIEVAEMNKVLIAFLQRIDVFAIWQAAIWAIGLKVIYNLSTARATAIAAVTWFLFVIPGLLGVILATRGAA